MFTIEFFEPAELRGSLIYKAAYPVNLLKSTVKFTGLNVMIAYPASPASIVLLTISIFVNSAWLPPTVRACVLPAPVASRFA